MKSLGNWRGCINIIFSSLIRSKDSGGQHLIWISKLLQITGALPKLLARKGNALSCRAVTKAQGIPSSQADAGLGELLKVCTRRERRHVGELQHIQAFLGHLWQWFLFAFEKHHCYKQQCFGLELTLNPLAAWLKWRVHVNSFPYPSPSRLASDLADSLYSTWNVNTCSLTSFSNPKLFLFTSQW